MKATVIPKLTANQRKLLQIFREPSTNGHGYIYPSRAETYPDPNHQKRKFSKKTFESLWMRGLIQKHGPAQDAPHIQLWELTEIGFKILDRIGE